jgi:glycosyltransferase involved in cell wall biosynthesis
MKALDPKTQKSLSGVEHAGVVVGIPCYNSMRTIGHVVTQVAMGLSTYFDDQDCLILISDGGSTDGTLGIAGSIHIPRSLRFFACRYQGISGKGSAVKAIFEAAISVGAESLAMVDSDLESITPEWIKLLVGPTLNGAGLVAPRYTRHKYDGTITNQLCYPLTRALYGLRIRQPIGGDFGISGKLASRLIGNPLWQTPYVPRFGIDIFITNSAIAEGFVVEEADLGAKIHAVKDPSSQLASMFREVAGSALSCMQRYEDSWRKVKGSVAVRLHKDHVERIEPQEVTASAQRLAEHFLVLYAQSSHFKSTLSPNLRHELDIRASSDVENFRIPTWVWAKTLYEVAARFKNSDDLAKSVLLEGLRTVWTGKVATFVRETSSMNNDQAERLVEEDAAYFEQTKDELMSIY